MKKIIRTILLLLSLIIYIYGFGLVSFPIGPRTIIDIAGLAWLMVDGKKYINVFSKKYISLFVFTIVISMWGLVTMLANGSDEALFLRYSKYFFPWIGGSYFIFRLSRGVIEDFKSLSIFLAISVGLESIIAVLIKFVPSVSMMISQYVLFKTGQFENAIENILDYHRIIGLGDAVFFGVLPSCTIGLFSCIYLLKKETRRLAVVGYLLLFLVITIVSFFTARTSGFVFVISIFLYLIYHWKGNNNTSVIKLLLSLGVLLFMLTSIIPKDFIPENMLEFATNLDSNGSASHLKEWYEEVSFTPSTFLIGDAHYEGPDGSYYGGMDVGYFRLIFYGGIIGLLLVIFYYYFFFKKMINQTNESEIKLFFVAFFISYLVMMLKGHIEFVDLLILYLVFLDGLKCNYPNNKNRILKA